VKTLKENAQSVDSLGSAKAAATSWVGKIWAFKKKKVLPYAKEGAIVWVINFIILEILISGGRYEQDTYIGVLSILFALTIMLFFSLKKPVLGLIDNIYRGASAFLTYAIIDYFVVTWVLEKNNFRLYAFWGQIATYALILVTPIVIELIRKYWLMRKNRG